jgi:transcription elongation factor GreB
LFYLHHHTSKRTVRGSLLTAEAVTIAGMNKAFVKESDADDDEEAAALALAIPAGSKNYITPAGYQRIKDELLQLIDVDRPEVVRIVHWAASNGDRSENGDYIYGKRRLREIDRRIRFLTKRMDTAAIVDPSVHHGSDQVFFGATVTYCNQNDETRTITIVGIDELDPLNGKISWVAPVARALTKAREGDVISFQAPHGVEELEILEVSYPEPAAD